MAIALAITITAIVAIGLLIVLFKEIRVLRYVYNAAEVLPVVVGLWFAYKVWQDEHSVINATISLAFGVLFGLMVSAFFVFIPLDGALDTTELDLDSWSLYGVMVRWVQNRWHLPPTDDEWKNIPDESDLTYADYLESESWQQRRQYKLARAGHRCQVCNTSGPLDVHHRTYERLGNEHPDDLLVVCRQCHDLVHDRPETVGPIAPKRRRDPAYGILQDPQVMTIPDKFDFDTPEFQEFVNGLDRDHPLTRDLSTLRLTQAQFRRAMEIREKLSTAGPEQVCRAVPQADYLHQLRDGRYSPRQAKKFKLYLLGTPEDRIQDYLFMHSDRVGILNRCHFLELPHGVVTQTDIDDFFGNERLHREVKNSIGVETMVVGSYFTNAFFSASAYGRIPPLSTRTQSHSVYVVWNYTDGWEIAHGYFATLVEDFDTLATREPLPANFVRRDNLD